MKKHIPNKLRKIYPPLYWILFSPILLSLLTPSWGIAQVQIDKFPSDFQLYNRTTSTNSANITVSGSINQSTGYTVLVLQVFRDGTLINTQSAALTYTNNTAPFSFQQTIVAELHNYSFKLYSNTSILLKSAESVVAGDAYILSGQSNIAPGSGGQFNATNNFIRNYADNGYSTYWEVANMYLGGIAYRFSDLLTQSQGIPIAIMNGAEGGVPIETFQKDNAYPLNPNKNYGKLLNRYQKSGITFVKSFVWFQGESDAWQNVAGYKTAFNTLYQSWQSDYNFTNLYMFQVRGCGMNQYNSDVTEAIRQLSAEIPNTGIISTAGTEKIGDGCHYNLEGGYYVFAKRLHDLVAYSLYNTGSANGVYSPNVTNFKFSNAQKTQVQFQLVPSTDTFTWQNGLENDFFFSNPNIHVTSGSVNGHVVTLNLDNPFTDANPWAQYLARSPQATPQLPNQNDIGMLSFKYRPINDFNQLPVTLVNLKAQKTDEGIQLTWATSSEINSAFFEIQQSQDTKNWITLAQMMAQGQSSSIKNYTYLDPAPASGMNYYRLKMVDTDGSVAWSTIKSVETDRLSWITIYPNPVIDQLHLKTENLKSIQKVELIDVQGKRVYQPNLSVSGIIPVTHLPAGVYTARITDQNGKITSLRFIKIH